MDLGAGQGASTWFLAREGYDTHAIDGSFHAIKKLQAHLNTEQSFATVSVGEIGALPYKDNFFDAVVDITSMAHNTNCRGIVKEVARVLKQGGRLFSFIPRYECWRDPFLGKGAITFMTASDVKNVYRDLFEIAIGFTDQADPGTSDKVLRHWVIDARKP